MKPSIPATRVGTITYPFQRQIRTCARCGMRRKIHDPTCTGRLCRDCAQVVADLDEREVWT